MFDNLKCPFCFGKVTRKKEKCICEKGHRFIAYGRTVMRNDYRESKGTNGKRTRQGTVHKGKGTHKEVQE